MDKKKLNYILVVFLIIITILIMICSDGLKDLPYLLTNTNIKYVYLGILCMVGYWLMDSIIIAAITKTVHEEMSFLKSIKITMIGQYYSAITPFSTGGQPAQVYFMVNDSIPIGQATLILINKFVIYQIVITIYSFFMFFLKLSFIYVNIRTALFFIIVGIFLNVLLLIGITFLFFNPKMLRKIIFATFNFIDRKIKTIKDKGKYNEKIEHYLEEYTESINKVRENKKMSLFISIITIIQLTFYFSITYFVYRALGFNKASYFDILSIQSLLHMAVSVIPIPGTIGASEGGFYLLFKTFFNVKVVAYAMLLWRGLSYYLRLIVCGIVTLINHLLLRKKKTALSN